MSDVAPELLCRCDCHDEVIEGVTSMEHVRLEITVRLDDPLEAAIACTHCYIWHHRARHRPREAA